MNAHGLLNAIFRAVKSESINVFLPWQYNSQTCESFFRMLRSMSTTFSTVVNCSLLDVIHKVKRIQLQENISSLDFSQLGINFNFPRGKYFHASFDIQNDNTASPSPILDKSDMIPSFETIKSIVEQAKTDAYKMITELGIIIEINSADNIQIQSVINQVIDNDNQYSSDEEDSILDESSDESFIINELLKDSRVELDVTEISDVICATSTSDLISLSSIEGTFVFPDNKTTKKQLDETSPFTVIKDSQEKEYVVRKSSICWMFNDKSKKLTREGY
ncbi:hypothetical protein ABEB36_014516 [Hypothenemus hampei]|uniref:Uncharacterized protein n=1 Tax=Hypothenemus hampei TaxID=57062 RepID=A0ABD1E433_HYPHA